MRTLRRWRGRLRGLFGRDRTDGEFEAELAAHLELHIEDGVRAGLSRTEARREALIKLGGIAGVQESYRGQRSVPWLENLSRDLLYSLRLLRKSPAWTVVAVLSLALGIGANTAVFSLVNGVLLRTLPYPEPDRLLRPAAAVNLPEYDALRQQASVFAGVAGQQARGSRLFASGDRSEWLSILAVTPGFFRTLGVPLFMGEEFASAGAQRSAIVSHEVWRLHLGGRPDAIGRVVELDGAPYTVVGVTPPSLWLPEKPGLLIPLLPSGTAGDLGTNTEVIARLASGVDRQRADSAAEAAVEDFRRSHPDYARKSGSLRFILYRDWLVGDVRGKLLVLSSAVGLVLLIACFNLVGLLTARLSARQREVAVLLALGSSRSRLLQQFLIETLLVCIAGGLAGVVGAWWMLDSFVALVPFGLPAAGGIRVDWQVFGFAAILTLVAGLMVGLVPGLMFSRLNVQSGMKQSAREGGGRSRLRGVLAVSEVAAATALLAGAGLLLHSLYRLHHQPMGFRPEGLLTFRTPSPPRSNAARQYQLTAAIHEQLSMLPGVRGAAAVSVLPLVDKNNFPAQRTGHAEQSIGGMEVRIVTPDYFATMGTPVRRGRGFNVSDAEQAAPVVLINETLARQWWVQEDPIGDRIDVGSFRGQPVMREATREIVGVVADMKTLYLNEPPRPTIFIPFAQARWYERGMNWVVRAEATGGLGEAVRRKIAEIAPSQRIERMQTMDQVIASTTADTRFHATLFAAFAAFAVLLAALGVYGILAFSVARRTSEIGIRMALGAAPGQVLRMVLRQGLQLIAVGLAVGLVGALAVGRGLSRFLFGVSQADPLSLVGVGALLAAAGLLASYLPARRATHVDPVAALRWE